MKGLNRLKKYSVIYEEELHGLNIHRAIECKIQDTTGLFFQKFEKLDQKLAELGNYCA